MSLRYRFGQRGLCSSFVAATDCPIAVSQQSHGAEHHDPERDAGHHQFRECLVHGNLPFLHVDKNNAAARAVL